MKQFHDQQRSKFFSLENHFLNTFFSGLYLSAADFITIAQSNNINLDMHSREMLIKELLNQADSKGILANVINSLNVMIDERISAYHRLSLEYPGARAPLAKLAQKSTGTKSLMAREIRGNPYE